MALMQDSAGAAAVTDSAAASGAPPPSTPAELRDALFCAVLRFLDTEVAAPGWAEAAGRTHRDTAAWEKELGDGQAAFVARVVAPHEDALRWPQVAWGG